MLNVIIIMDLCDSMNIGYLNILKYILIRPKLRIESAPYGFYADENLPPNLPQFLHQIIFKGDEHARNVKFQPYTIILCISLSENLSLVRGRSVSMTLL